jgi:hypothetical protein
MKGGKVTAFADCIKERGSKRRIYERLMAAFVDKLKRKRCNKNKRG